MTLQVRVLPAAQAELVDAIAFYRVDDARVARRLTFEVDRVLRQIRRFPASSTVLRRSGGVNVRRFTMKVFPIAVIYCEYGAELVILAFAHQRRSPGYWRQRVRLLGG